MRVLVVDDNTDAAFLLTELIRRCGHETELANFPDDALRIATRWQPELVLLDLAMPGETGYHLAPRIREAVGRKDLRIIAVSGYPNYEIGRRAARIDGHLLKPVSVVQLRAALRQHVNVPSDAGDLEESFSTNDAGSTALVSSTTLE